MSNRAELSPRTGTFSNSGESGRGGNRVEEDRARIRDINRGTVDFTGVES